MVLGRNNLQQKKGNCFVKKELKKMKIEERKKIEQLYLCLVNVKTLIKENYLLVDKSCLRLASVYELGVNRRVM